MLCKSCPDSTFPLNLSAGIPPVWRSARDVSVGVHRERHVEAVEFVESDALPDFKKFLLVQNVGFYDIAQIIGCIS